MVPPEDSTKDGWGCGRRAKNVRSLFSKYVESGEVQFVNTVKTKLGELGYPDPAAEALWDDSVHMDPKVTEEVNEAYWEEISEIQATNRSQHKIPLLIWDYNATIGQMQKRWKDHVAWWDAALGWANCDSRTDPSGRKLLQGSVNSLIGDGYPGDSFYGVNLHKPAKGKNRGSYEHQQRVAAFQVHNYAWNPLELACDVVTTRGLLAQTVSAEAAANLQGWPEEAAEAVWLHWLGEAWRLANLDTSARAGSKRGTGEVKGEVKRMWLKNKGYRRPLLWSIMKRYDVTSQVIYEALAAHPKLKDPPSEQQRAFAKSVSVFKTKLGAGETQMQIVAERLRRAIRERCEAEQAAGQIGKETTAPTVETATVAGTTGVGLKRKVGGETKRAVGTLEQASVGSTKTSHRRRKRARIVEAPFNAKTLEGHTWEERKQMIGERLHPLVAAVQPAEAGKITGMILELGTAELLSLLESEEQLQVKVMDCISILEADAAVGRGVQEMAAPATKEFKVRQKRNLPNEARSAMEPRENVRSRPGESSAPYAGGSRKEAPAASNPEGSEREPVENGSQRREERGAAGRETHGSKRGTQ